MSAPVTRTTPIAWERRMQMRNGKIGRYHGVCSVTGKHRVVTSNRFGEWTDVKDTYATWLLDDFGFARGDRAPCGEDCVGPVAQVAA